MYIWTIKIDSAKKKKKRRVEFGELLRKQMKADNKEVALGTSKINYMDPRIKWTQPRAIAIASERLNWTELKVTIMIIYLLYLKESKVKSIKN
jgi:DNA topoisomerase-1